MQIVFLSIFCVLFPFLGACDSQDAGLGNGNNGKPSEEEPVVYEMEEFAMGVDLSYVNQVLDHGGEFKDTTGATVNPYAHFAERGANVVRVRLWHTPDWVRKEVYENPDKPLYSGLRDVTETIRKAKAEDMAVNLDFHYSDVWADPGTQEIPQAWRDIEDLDVLKDSVYQYTRGVLGHLNQEGLMPEMVQIGNETNCGMMFSNAPSSFPALNVCDGNWANFGEVVNAGIQAVRDVAESSNVETKVLLHVAQPENVEWFFDNVTTQGNVTNFDVVGFSYYAPWSDVSLDEISGNVANFRESYQRDVMILETAYSWTMENADDYSNIFGEGSLVDGYLATPQGQKDYLIDLTQEVIDGGGGGVMYWEPAWITSNMRDLWRQGSAWENNAFYNFQGQALPVFHFMTHPYSFN